MSGPTFFNEEIKHYNSAFSAAKTSVLRAFYLTVNVLKLTLKHIKIPFRKGMGVKEKLVIGGAGSVGDDGPGSNLSKQIHPSEIRISALRLPHVSLIFVITLSAKIVWQFTKSSPKTSQNGAHATCSPLQAAKVLVSCSTRWRHLSNNNKIRPKFCAMGRLKTTSHY